MKTPTTPISSNLRRALVLALSGLTGFVAGMPAALATPAVLSDIPLFAIQGVQPNIVVTMDDSGSMAWAHMPDSIVNDYDKHAGKSAHYNKIYYDPAISYEPGVDENGVSLGDADFFAAWENGYDLAGRGGNVTNLSISFRVLWGPGNSGGPDYSSDPAQPAFYYLFDASNDALVCGDPANVDNDVCYDKVVVGAAERQNFANWYAYYRTRQLVAKSATTRAFGGLNHKIRLGYQLLKDASVTGVDEFSGAHRSTFFDWLHNVPNSGYTPARRALQRVGDYYSTTGAGNPYRDDPAGGTGELRSCRQSFAVLMTDGFWNGEVGLSGNIDSTSAALPAASAGNPDDLGITSYTPGQRVNNIYSDGNSGSLADNSFHYWANDLQTGLDNNVPTYIVDATSDLDDDGDVDEVDKFWNPKNDPATWQHMVTFTIGLGVDGTLNYGTNTYDGDYANLLLGTAYDAVNGKEWGDTATNINRVDDLWHAAINSRGQYFSARNPNELVDAFAEVLDSILKRQGSAAAVSLSSATISGGSSVFQAVFDTNDWSGRLYMKEISDGNGSSSACPSLAAGEVCHEPVWEAGCVLDGGTLTLDVGKSMGDSKVYYCDNPSPRDPDTRNIVTMHSDTGAGVPLRWNSLSVAQQTALQRAGDTQPDAAEKRLEYLRGDQSLEGAASYGFRQRNTLLGDIVNVQPVFVGPPSRFYRPDQFVFTPGSVFPYFKFKEEDYDDRRPVVYVGANDGMLHAFDAETGEELFAYVPAALFDSLGDLSDSGYAHRSYVDGPIVVEDAELSGGWRSVLVGSLRLGGRAVYALDVTDPSTFTSEGSVAGNVMWEFTEAELGNLFGEVTVVRVRAGDPQKGTWAAVFGNGYNNPDSEGDAVLYVVDLETGALLKKISTATGIAEDPTGQGRINGLSEVTVADVDDDAYADYVYGGDLFGNLWKFDLRSNDITQWTVSFGTPASPEPFYRTVDDTGTPQPITTAPAVGLHPSGEGQLVFVGTGRYLGRPDLFDASRQTVYGLWDKNDQHTAFTRGELLEQAFIGSDDKHLAHGFLARGVTKRPMTWFDDPAGGLPSSGSGQYLGWYLELSETGERVHVRPFLRNNRLSFVTVTPNSDPCSSGGSSWLVEVSMVSGGRLEPSAFDYNLDGRFDADDVTDLTDPDSGDAVMGSGIRQEDGGIYTSAETAVKSTAEELRYLGDSEPNIFAPVARGLPRFPSVWRELIDD